MDLRDLEVFRVVAREKSFSQAAKMLYRTQPAISLTVRRLEDELGETLFSRSAKVPSLTDAGTLLLEYAERLLNLSDEVRPALAELRQLQRGRVRVGANETGALYLLPIIARYRQFHPQIKVEVVRTLARHIPQELLKRSLDLGVLTYKPEDGRLTTLVVHADRLSFIVHPTHPLTRRHRVSIRELGQESFAAHNVWSPYRERVLRIFERHRVPLNMDVELPTVESIKKFVQMKRAVALVPLISVEDELSKGSLKEIKVPELHIERKIQVVFRRGEALSHAADAFLQVMTTSSKES